jgi:hypothetical protein
MATSSNLVRLAIIEETAYGVTPVAGDFETVRFTSESLSGSPDTVESQFIRTDRLSSGQVVTGLAIEGGLSFELAKDSVFEKLMASAMYSSWVSTALVTVTLDLDATAKTLTRAAGDWATDPTPVRVGDIITLAGFANALNNVQVMVTGITSATVITFAGPNTVVTQTGGTSYKLADRLEIGATKKSFSVEKKFTDMTDKGLQYRGLICSELALNVAFGELITTEATLQGNGYQAVDQAADFITNARTVLAPATTQSLNGSVDMPFVTTNATGTFSSDGLDIQSIGININNNLTPTNVIGNIAPRDYTPGTAQVEVSLMAYLTDPSWALLARKLTQDPFAVGFMVKNAGGFYGFYMPEVQVTFDDPSSGGQNQDVMFDASGVAKVGAGGLSSLRIFRG